jgi:threonylcarbamoyladenosine tRNA methylthiotransferase MtaB
VIVGFPGETEVEFAESLAFVGELGSAGGLAGGHVFTYSARPGTAAARMPNQVTPSVRKERNARMRAILAGAATSYQARFLGRVLPVLWESTSGLGPEGWQLSGLTDNYLRVKAPSPRHLTNRITPVRLVSVTPDGLLGTMV